MIIKGQEDSTYRSDVRRILMLQQPMHLLYSKFHGEELVQKAKCCWRTTAVSSHPWLHMINLIINFIHHFMVCLQTIKLLKVIRRQNIHTKNLLQQRINWFPASLYLHYGSSTRHPPAGTRIYNYIINSEIKNN